MAKKAGTAQLQVELNNDEELDNFLLKTGLCLLDIYSEWCGPCLGLISALKKIKLEIAGDSLNLGIARSEGISYFKRFIRKSEPTWLFVVNQRSVNIAFGSNQPSLIKLVMDELAALGKVRKSYDLAELLPLEIERNREADEARAAEEARLAQEKAENRLNYLNFVTDTINENLPDGAVTIFGSHVPRDVVKKIVDMAESFQIHCKDRRYVVISKEEFETINFKCRNPLPEDVQELYGQEEVLVCYWKLPETNLKALHAFGKELYKPRTAKDDEGETVKLKALLKNETVKVQYILESDEDYEEPPEPEPEVDETVEQPPPPPQEAQPAPVQETEHEMEGEEGDEEEEDGVQPPALDEPPPPPPPLDFDLGIDLGSMEDEGEEEDEGEYLRVGIKYVKVPGIWIPDDMKTHAALIYVLFRSQTTPFLPPDPVPDPPHIIMAFDAHRRKQLIDVVNRNSDKIFYSGFFTSDDVNDAEFIARTPEMYDLVTKSSEDKYVLRVNKVTSHMMLSLATYNPTYVSPSVEVGMEEAKVFFPENYKSASKEALEVLEQSKRVKKDKKLTKTVDGKEIELDDDVDDDEGGHTEEAEEEQLAEVSEPVDDVPAAIEGEKDEDQHEHEHEDHMAHYEGEDHDEKDEHLGSEEGGERGDGDHRSYEHGHEGSEEDKHKHDEAAGEEHRPKAPEEPPKETEDKPKEPAEKPKEEESEPPKKKEDADDT